ncbi:hypothetical protein F4703DRAFT_1798323 [Phycomyces blakesleeanus]
MAIRAAVVSKVNITVFLFFSMVDSISAVLDFSCNNFVIQPASHTYPAVAATVGYWKDKFQIRAKMSNLQKKQRSLVHRLLMKICGISALGLPTKLAPYRSDTVYPAGIATTLSQYEYVLICDKSNIRVSGSPQDYYVLDDLPHIN